MKNSNEQKKPIEESSDQDWYLCCACPHC